LGDKYNCIYTIVIGHIKNTDWKPTMTTRQKLILFLIYCNPGIRDIYQMVKVYDRADFPSSMEENLKPLLEEGLIYVSKNLDNGTPFIYEITEEGIIYLEQNFDDIEIIEYVKNMQNPYLLLQITQSYIDRKNGL
jgi:DNA-binding MarR family transcriptional regulator